MPIRRQRLAPRWFARRHLVVDRPIHPFGCEVRIRPMAVGRDGVLLERVGPVDVDERRHRRALSQLVMN